MDKNVYKRMMDQAVPSADLIQRTKRKMIKEKPVMIKRSLKTAVIAAALVMMVAGTAFAAWHLLTPGEVAEQLGHPTLSAAFNSENAINLNASQTAGGYIFTLMSIVSGDDISDQRVYAEAEVLRDRTYAVVAIQKEDGSPMDFDEFFFIRPFIRGIMPWHFGLSGGGNAAIIDGVKYVLVEFDDMTIFADRGVYIGINSGWDYVNAFIFEETRIRPNPDFDGVNILFEIPLDVSLADPAKAQELLDAFWEEDSSGDSGSHRFSVGEIIDEE